MECLFDPAGCLSSALTNLVATVPWEWTIGALVAGTIVGASLGWLGVFASIAAVLAYFGGRSRVGLSSEQQYPHPDEKPAPKKRKTIF